MYNSLDGQLSESKMIDIENYTKLRFKDVEKLRLAYAFTIFEQRYLDETLLHQLCEKEVGIPLEVPIVSYMSSDIIKQFEGTNLVPVTLLPSMKKIICACTPDIDYKLIEYPNFNVEVVNTTIYFYLQQYNRVYGRHSILLDVPAKYLADIIVKEAIELEASDITISTLARSSQVYFNVRKRKVYSNRILSYEDMEDIIRYFCNKSPYDSAKRDPKYVDFDLNKDYRGRIVINKKFKGFVITMRLLPNSVFETELEDLNLAPNTIDFIRTNVMDNRTGLRLIVGATMSGKNTTALSMLREFNYDDSLKIVSVEKPVEQEIPGMEQINTESEEEYRLNLESLIRQNPDFVYLTEIGDTTAITIIKMTNTGKKVLSTLHANSVSQTITRLMDITGLSSDRIIQTLHSVVYQELVRNDKEDKLYPMTRYVVFDDDFKDSLFGKSIGEVLKMIRQREDGDTWVI